MSRRLVVAGLIVLPAVAAAWVFAAELETALRGALAWIEGAGAWAPAVYVAVSVLAVVLFAPAAPFYMAAGLLFGLVQGAAWAFAVTTLAGAAAFLVARYLARDLVERRLRDHEAFQAVDQAVRREGLRAAFLIRCSPILPSSLLNYGLGLSSLRFRHHLLGSLAAFPGTFLFVYYGKALGDLAALFRDQGPEKGPWYYALLIGGAAATLLATRQVTLRARRILEASESEG